ncbi:YadA-like family protein [Citrobacter amalonaticus]|uniref:YadA-like family protein n=1 Tax=Citrobacter amalonaticus TaxID=35703 RepID=UPI0038907CEF
MSIGDKDIDMTRTITGLAAGRVSGTSTDAINGSQLYAFQNAMDKLALDNSFHFLDNAGDGVSVTNGGTLQFKSQNSNIAIDQKGVADAGIMDITLSNDLDLTAAGSLTIGNSLLNNNGLTITGGPSITTGGIDAGGKTITNVAPGVNGTDAVNVDQLNAVDAVANAGWNVADADGNTHNVKPGDTATFASADSNVTVTQKDGTVTVDLADSLDLGATGSVTMGDTTVNNGGLTITGGPSITTGGIDAGGKTITNVAPGVDGTDAVNVDQLTDLGDGLKNTGLNLAGNSGTGHLNLGDTLTIKGEGTTGGTYSGANLKTEVGADGSLNIVMAEAPKFGNVTINDNGSGKITGVTAGTAGTDAVNVDQLNAVDAVANAGWNVTDAAGNTANIGPNGKVTFTSADSNLSVEQAGTEDAGKVVMTLNRDLDLDSVTTGQTVVNNNGLTITGGPSITTAGIDAGGKTITNVAPGVDGTDAVNVDQLNAVDAVANAGWNVADADGNTHNVKPGDTATFASADSNVTVTQKDGTVTVDLADSLDLGATGSVTMGDTTVSNGGLTITGGPSITTGGIDAGGKTITNVAPGVDGTDAVNVDQLTDLGDGLKNTGLNLAGNSGTGHLNLGDTLTIKGEGTTGGTYSGANLKTEVGADGSLNIVMAEAPKFGNVTINDNGSGKITGVTAGTAGTDAVNVDQLNAVDAVANAGWNVADADGNTHNVKPGDTATFASADSNVTVTQKDGTVTVDLADSLDLGATGSVTMGDTTVSNGGLTITGGPSITTGGIDAGGKTITNVAPGVDGTDAVNVDQLTDLGDGLKNTGLNLAGNSGTGHLNLGDTLTIKGEGTTGGTYSGANLKTEVGADGSLNIVMAEAPKFGNVTINDNGSGKITGVTAGTAGTDAVNVDQLNAVDAVANAGWNVADADGNTHNVKPGDTATFASADSNVTVTQKDGTVTVDLADSLDLGATGSVTMGDTTVNNGGLTITGGPSITTGGIDAGGKTITNVAPGVDGTDAVNVDQLTDLGDGLKNTGLNLAGNSGTGHLNLGDTLTIKGEGTTGGTYSGANLKTEVGADGSLNIVMAEAPKFGNVTINDNGSGKITGVAAGTAGTDAVNVDQLNAVDAVANAGWNVTDAAGNTVNIGANGEVAFTSADSNLSVEQAGTEDAGKVVMTLNRDLDLDSVTTGQTVVNNNGLTITGGPSITTAGIDAGNKKITNVAAGTAATDAVNVSQLTDAQTDLSNAGLNLAGNSGTGHLNLGDTLTIKGEGTTGGTYSGANLKTEVGADGSLNIVMAEAPKFGNVTINDNGSGKITGVTAGTAGTDAVNVDQLTDLGDGLTNTGLNLAGNSGTGHLNLGDTLTIKGEGTTGGTYSGANLKTEVGADGSLNIVMAEAPKFGNVTINDNGSGKITGVTAGTAGTDAVNVDQLNAVDAVANAGWNVADADGNTHNVKPGDTATFASADSNVTVTQKDGTVTVDLADSLDLGATGSVTMGDTTVNNGGLTITGGPSITTGGIDAGGKTITNVAPGVDGTDAVNVDQLTDLGDGLTNTGLNLAGNSGTGHLNLGDTLTIKGEGTTGGTYSGANLKTEVGADGSLNIVMAEAPKFGNVTINDNGSGKITGVTAGTAGTDAVNVDQLNAVDAVANAGWNVADADGNTHNVKPGDTATFASADSNVTVTQKDGTVTVDLADSLDLGATGSVTMGDTTVSNGGLTITGGPSITTGGIDAGGKTITNVAPGVDGTDAVNVDQLTDLGDGLKNTGLNLAGNSGTGHLNLGDTLTIKGEGTTGGTYSGANLKTEVGADGSLNIVMAEAPKFGNVTINDNGSGKITGVTAGTAGTDAVNVDQLNAVDAVANAGWNVADADGNTHNVKPGDTATFASADSNVTVTQKDGTVTVDLADSLDLGATGSVTMGDTTVNNGGLTITGGPSITTGGIDAGGKTITNVAPGVDGTDAVNVDQLTDLGDGLTNTGLNLAGNSGTGHLNLGDTLTIKGEGTTGGTYSGANLKTEVGADGSLNIVMAEAPKFGNVTINDNGSGKITGVTAGTAGTDAVNVDQLNAVDAVANAGWNVTDAAGNTANIGPNGKVTFTSADSNLSVEQAGTDDAGKVVMTLNRDLDLDSVTTGQTVMNNDGLKVGNNVMLGVDGLIIANGPSVTVNGIDAGGKRITNVEAGIDDLDAVNVAQLNQKAGDIVNNIYNSGVKYFHANSSRSDSLATGVDSIAIGPDAVASGNNAIASGSGAIASGGNSVATGNNATASQDGAVAVGNGATASGVGSVAMGDGAKATHDNSVALGAGSVTDRENSVSVGAEGDERYITNVKAGEKDTDAVNVSQLNGLGEQITNLGDSVINMGDNVTNLREGKDGMFQVNNTSGYSKPKPTGKDSLAGGAGAKASGSNSMAVGTNSSATGENSVALGNGSSSKAKNSVALGANSVADRDNSVSVGTVGAERQITNVAAGTRGTDAVNVSQLKDAVKSSNQYTDNKFGKLKNMVEKQGDKMSAGVAGAMAMAGLPQPYAPGASMVALGAGSFQGQSAVALGVSTISDNGKWVTKLSGSTNTQGDFGVNVGIGYQW